MSSLEHAVPPNPDAPRSPSPPPRKVEKRKADNLPDVLAMDEDAVYKELVSLKKICVAPTEEAVSLLNSELAKAKADEAACRQSIICFNTEISVAQESLRVLIERRDQTELDGHAALRAVGAKEKELATMGPKELTAEQEARRAELKARLTELLG